VARKFNFYDWISGRSSEAKKTADLRRFVILVGCVITLLVAGGILRRFFWSGAGDNPEHHAHEKGPHGGVVVAIHHGEPHYHAEFVIANDGRVSLFTFGSETDQILKLKPQRLIAHVQPGGKEEAASLILRPAGKTSEETSQFVGRMPPYLVGEKVAISISHIEIDGKVYSFQFEISNHFSAEDALELEKKLLLTPGGIYTQVDIDANGRIAAFEKFRNVKVVHSLQGGPEDRLCPVTQTKANPRIAWKVGGKTYEFCCPSCIPDFVANAKDEELSPSEDS